MGEMQASLDPEDLPRGQGGRRPLSRGRRGRLSEDACRLHDFFLRYSLADGALDGVARIVERADLGREGTRDQGAGLAAMVAGPGDVFRSDGARVSPALPLFYAGCRRRALHGVTPGRS